MSSAAKWILGIIGGILGGVVFVVVGVFLAGTSLVGSILGGDAFETESETRHTQVINAVTHVQEVSLLSLGIQGIKERTDKTTFFGVDIPGSERAVFLQYQFTGKLGIDGEDVRIEQTGEKKYTVSIPKFIVLGFDKPHFKIAVENNGVLSWTTPSIDTTEMINSILSKEAFQEHLDAHEEVLRSQAKAFYGGIVSSIDPEIRLRFEFDSSSS